MLDDVAQRWMKILNKVKLDSTSANTSKPGRHVASNNRLNAIEPTCWPRFKEPLYICIPIGYSVT
jgi:hypothetical protein